MLLTSPSSLSCAPAPAEAFQPLLAGRNYRCQCGQPVFFRNSKCLACGTPLGYDCEQGRLLALAALPQALPSTGGAAQPALWRSWQAGDRVGETTGGTTGDTTGDKASGAGATAYRRCANLSTPASCNWLIPQGDPQPLCRACRLNRTIPDLADPTWPDNGHLWGLVETAKRRLVSSLILLGLPVASRISEDPVHGLMFDVLRASAGGPHVMTGHDTGLITLNLDEADDAKREAVRKALREPYRTLLGHLRHEAGHYYWGRLVAGSPWLEGFHQLFGDESVDYAASLQRNYTHGPPADWSRHFVSAYASSHPWEDWAECWAHYLHMRDAIDTALSFGLSVDRFDLEFTPFTLDDLYQPDHPDAAGFLALLNHWARLTTMLTEMSRSMGQPDFYPFALARLVVAKLHFIHRVVSSSACLAGGATG